MTTEVPSHMGSMISNLCAAYRQRFSKITPLTNEVVYEIIEEVGVLPTGEETNDAILEEMFYKVHKMYPEDLIK